MLSKMIKRLMLLIAMGFSANIAVAEDIDIFLNNPNVSKTNPNILFLLDNTANWSGVFDGDTKFAREIEAMKQVVMGLDDSVNVGLMLLSEPPQGGYMRFGIRPMTEDNKKLFVNVLNRLDVLNDKTSGGAPYGAAMFEAYKMFGGGDGTLSPVGPEGHGPEAYSGYISGSSIKLQDFRDYKGNTYIYGGAWTQPLEFTIETDGFILDNNATYTITCGGAVIATGTLLPGEYQTVSDLTCASAKWQVNVQSVTWGDMVSWELREQKSGLLVMRGGPYSYGYNDTQTDPVPYTGGAALSDASDTTYTSPITDSCQKNFIIMISNGSPPTNSDSHSADIMKTLGGDTTVINLPSSRSTANWGDEFARFLNDTDISPLDGQQKVITYSIAVFKTPISGQDPNNVELMRSVANQGEGSYFPATNAYELRAALEKILNEIQAVDSVFASVTLPVSVNVRGTHLNQVYMGVFRPHELDLPQWFGNLKQYKLNKDNITNAIFLADANGNPVHSAVTGFVRDEAESIWTEYSSYWWFDPTGNTSWPWSDLPDGPIVEKGGVAQQLRLDYATDQSGRKIYTGNMIAFDKAAINTADQDVLNAFGAFDQVELELIIDWARGADNLVDENSDGLFTDVRSSVHGDVLHSQPAVVSYGSDDNVVIYYGSNDGLLRAVQGGTGTGSGKELWAYAAPEFYPVFKKLRDNSIVRDEFNPKSYGFDGPITTMSSGGKRYIFVGARRGGRLLYAFDVTDPVNPGFAWKLTPESSGMDELGQTWSAPIPAKISAHPDPVLIFAGGYDPNQDMTDPGNDSMGRAIFILDAFTGDLLWQAGPSPSGAIKENLKVDTMEYSIPSDLTVIDRNGDGKMDRGYVGDMGGNVWRLDMGTDFTQFKVSRIASLGYDAQSSSQDRRKFFYGPDVVYTEDSNGKYDAIILGSGDRTKPHEEDVENAFYVLKDRYVAGNYGGTEPLIIDDLYDATDNIIQNGSDADKLEAAKAFENGPGAYMWLLKGEKVISKALTLSEVTMFNTNQPTSAAEPGTCASNLGIARLYQVFFKDLSGATEDDDRFIESPGGGFPPSPTGIIFDDGSKINEVVCTGTFCTPAPKSDLGRRFRVFWTEIFD